MTLWAAWLGVAALVAYSYGLGAAAMLVYRLYGGPIRYVPALATAGYYVLSYLSPHPAYVALGAGLGYDPVAALKLLLSAVSIGLSLLLLARRAKENAAKENRHG